LARYGQVSAVAISPVGTNLDQPAYILIDFPTEISFGNVVPIHQFPDAVDLFLG
jgi:hypothetical protein